MTERSVEDLKALVVLNRLPLGGQREARVQIEAGAAPFSVLEGLKERGLAPFEGTVPFSGEEEIEKCRVYGIRLVTFFDPDYPSLLKEIYDPPLVLYIKGSLEETDSSAAAIVGTRHPSFYGITQAKRFARGLAEKGLTIVSGFAKGIDQAAHRGALEVSYGRTIAVLGCGLDVEYPAGSRDLAQRIAERGAVVSEYPLGTEPRAEFFPRRNRIISGLSLGVLVVEAAGRSGSLITAREALEQGREVFAMPGPVDQLTSKGTHALLKEGAHLAEDPEDILQVLAFSLASLMKKQLNPVSDSVHAIVPLSSPNVLVGDLRQRTDPPLADSDGFPPPPNNVGRIRPRCVAEKTCGNDIREKNDSLTQESKILDLLRRHPMTYEEIQEQASLPSAQIAAVLTQLEIRRKVRKTLQGAFCTLDLAHNCGFK